jgi:hypothetical protein
MMGKLESQIWGLMRVGKLTSDWRIGLEKEHYLQLGRRP